MSMNILLIEDDQDLHAAIQAYLEGQGHRVTPCWSIADAGKALAAIAPHAQAPDVIVSDSNGMTFYLKARQRFPGMRWIVTARPTEIPHVGNPLTTSVGLPAARLPASPALPATDTIRPDALPTTQPPLPITQGD